MNKAVELARGVDRLAFQSLTRARRAKQSFVKGSGEEAPRKHQKFTQNGIFHVAESIEFEK